MALSAVDVVSPAFERMKQQLFKPFRFGQWLRFALVGLLAGEMGTGGGCNANFPGSFPSGGGGSTPFPPVPRPGGLFILGLGLAVVLVLVLLVIFMYINSRMRFVLFDSIVDGECRIRNSWGRRGSPAFRYFAFQLLFLLAAFASVIVLIGIPLLLGFSLGLFRNPSQHVLALVFGGLILGFAFLAWIIGLALAQVLIKDFVVPQMALDDLTVSAAWSRLWSMMRAEKGSYAGYIGMKILLSIAAAVILGIIGVIVFLVLAIPVGGVGLATILGGRAAGLTWNPVTIAIAIVAGAIALLALFFVLSLISVPAIVFFPAYSIYFFAERYPPLHARMYPPSAPPELSSPSPQP